MEKYNEAADSKQTAITIAVVFVLLSFIGMFVYSIISGNRNSSDYALISIGICVLCPVITITITKLRWLSLIGVFTGSVALGVAIGVRIWG